MMQDRNEWREWIECVAGLFTMAAILAATLIVAAILES